MGGGGRGITAAASHSNGRGRGEGIRAFLVRNGAAGSERRLPELRRTAPSPASSATSADAGEGGEGGGVGGGESRAPPGGGADASHGGGGEDVLGLGSLGSSDFTTIEVTGRLLAIQWLGVAASFPTAGLAQLVLVK
jgi:hypothetical protein